MAHVTAGTLTKWQVAILLTAARRGRITTEVAGGRGPAGGRVSFGSLERKRCGRLREMGLLSHAGGNHDMLSERGNTIHLYTSHWHLTPAGRAVIES